MTKEKEALFLFHRAVASVDLGEQAAGLADYDRALKLTPDDADIWTNRGCVNVRTSNLSEARSDFEKALQLTPGDPDPRWGLADVLFRLGHADEACEHFEEAIRGYFRAGRLEDCAKAVIDSLSISALKQAKPPSGLKMDPAPSSAAAAHSNAPPCISAPAPSKNEAAPGEGPAPAAGDAHQSGSTAGNGKSTQPSAKAAPTAGAAPFKSANAPQSMHDGDSKNQA